MAHGVSRGLRPTIAQSLAGAAEIFRPCGAGRMRRPVTPGLRPHQVCSVSRPRWRLPALRLGSEQEPRRANAPKGRRAVATGEATRGFGIAIEHSGRIGIPVARDSLHRSQRGELPHWAPASGRDEPPPLSRSVRPIAATSRIRSSACCRPNPAQCPEPGLPARIALGLGPFPPSTPQVLPAWWELLCSPTSLVLL